MDTQCNLSSTVVQTVVQTDPWSSRWTGGPFFLPFNQSMFRHYISPLSDHWSKDYCSLLRPFSASLFLSLSLSPLFSSRVESLTSLSSEFRATVTESTFIGSIFIQLRVPFFQLHQSMHFTLAILGLRSWPWPLSSSSFSLSLSLFLFLYS